MATLKKLEAGVSLSFADGMDLFCPGESVLHGWRCHYLTLGALAWEDADVFCARDVPGGELASAATRDDVTFLASVAR